MKAPKIKGQSNKIIGMLAILVILLSPVIGGILYIARMPIFISESEKLSRVESLFDYIETNEISYINAQDPCKRIDYKEGAFLFDPSGNSNCSEKSQNVIDSKDLAIPDTNVPRKFTQEADSVFKIVRKRLRAIGMKKLVVDFDDFSIQAIEVHTDAWFNREVYVYKPDYTDQDIRHNLVLNSSRKINDNWFYVDSEWM